MTGEAKIHGKPTAYPGTMRSDTHFSFCLQVLSEVASLGYLEGHARAMPPATAIYKGDGIGLLYPAAKDTLTNRAVHLFKTDASTAEVEAEVKKVVTDILPLLDFLHSKVSFWV